ncbi:MAG TPA: hypothetical protein VGM82_05575 [Gemmatimonadaceae bacterium]
MRSFQRRQQRARGVNRRLRGLSLRSRRGIALFISMFFVAGIGALALSAIYLTANASLLAKTYEKEDDLKYASEAALQIGKAELNFNPAALPNTSYVRLLNNATMKAADGANVPGVVVNLFAGPSGSTSGQFGRFASVVSEARDPNGTGFVRRLELTQESFAKYAYWTNTENNVSGGTIVFGNGDAIWGPVWSNDTITIDNSGASFHDDVGTVAPIISNASHGTFDKGYQVRQRPIALPSLSSLTSLSGLATVSNYNLPSVTTGDESTLRSRLEFVAVDLNADGDSTDDNEGFFRVYTVTGTTAADYQWLRADFQGTGVSATTVQNCGDFHTINGKLQFFPVAAHRYSWFIPLLLANGYSGSVTSGAGYNEGNASIATIMGYSNARCYLGGDPHLSAVARNANAAYTGTTADKQKGGDDTTFTAVDPRGSWKTWTGTVVSALSAKAGWDRAASYMFPLYRGYNTSTKGVIYSGGTIGVSGVLRGVMTLYSPYTIVVLDDLRYANDPAAAVCIDILGTISGANTVVADNAMNTPIDVATSGHSYKNVDDTPGLNLHAVVMALGSSFTVEDYDQGPTSGVNCDGTNFGRGCLRLTGGLIQNRRGPVGVTNGTGYVKRYSYDRCAVTNPPPYFPTTGRFEDNRYYELDPVRVKSSVAGSIRSLYLTLTGGT